MIRCRINGLPSLCSLGFQRVRLPLSRAGRTESGVCVQPYRKEPVDVQDNLGLPGSTGTGWGLLLPPDGH